MTNNLTIDNPLDLKHIHNMFVYFDIVEPHAVGNVKGLIIRVLPVKGRYGEDISLYTTMFTTTPSIKSILIPSYGTVIVTLHFRLRRATQFVWNSQEMRHAPFSMS